MRLERRVSISVPFFFFFLGFLGLFITTLSRENSKKFEELLPLLIIYLFISLYGFNLLIFLIRDVRKIGLGRAPHPYSI